MLKSKLHLVHPGWDYDLEVLKNVRDPQMGNSHRVHRMIHETMPGKLFHGTPTMYSHTVTI